MAGKYSILSEFSTDKISQYAYKDYTEQAQNAYSRFVAMTASAIDRASETKTVDRLVDDIISKYAEYGYNRSTNVILNDIVTSLGEFLTEIITKEREQLTAIDQEQDSDINPEVTVHDVNLESYTCTISELLEQVNSTLHALVVEGAVASAFAIGGSVAEMVATCRDVVASKFVSSYTDVSNTLEKAISRIRSGIGFTEYIKQRMVEMGITAAKEDGATFSQSYDYEYYGATPASAYGFQMLWDRVVNRGENLFRIIGDALFGLFEDIGHKFAKSVSWAAITVYDFFRNPNDIDLINDKGNGTYDTLHHMDRFKADPDTYSDLIKSLRHAPIHMDLIPCELFLQLSYVKIDDLTIVELAHILCDVTGASHGATILTSLNNVATLCGYTGTAAISYDNAITNITGGSDYSSFFSRTYVYSALKDWLINTLRSTDDYSMYIDVYYKLKVMGNIPPILGWGTSDKYLNIGQTLDAMRSAVELNNVYLTECKNELVMYQHTAATFFYMEALLYAASLEMQGQSKEQIRNTNFYLDDYICDILRYQRDDPTEPYFYDDITNVDFFELLVNMSVWNTSIQTKIYRPILGSNYLSGYLVPALNGFFKYKKEYPFNYEFLPYQQNLAVWFDPSFKVRTDSENISRWVNYVDTAVNIAVIATIVIATFLIIKGLSRKAYLEQQGALWNATDHASTGTLTKSDIKWYKKATFKANLIDKLAGNTLAGATSAGLSGLGTAFNTNVSASVDLDPVINLIRG